VSGSRCRHPRRTTMSVVHQNRRHYSARPIQRIAQKPAPPRSAGQS
jgi:hypothetical protein